MIKNHGMTLSGASMRTLSLAGSAAICALLVFAAATLKIELPRLETPSEDEGATIVNAEPPPRPPVEQPRSQAPQAAPIPTQFPDVPYSEPVLTELEPSAPIASTGVSEGSVGEPAPVIARARPIGPAVQPSYPQRAIDRGKTGVVRVSLDIAADGSVAAATVVSEEPTGWGFGDAALRAARKSRFEPKLVDGRPVRGEFYYSYTFRLE